MGANTVTKSGGRRARAAIILAAGHGTRMKSAMSKVLHPVGGRAMLDWSVALARGLGCERVAVVVGRHNPDAERRAEALLGPGCTAVQDPPLGTAHAVRAAAPLFDGFEGDIIVLYADTPLIPVETAEQAFAALDGGAAAAVLGFEADEPGAYGRLVRDTAGGLQAIVEAREADPAILALRLCNSGVMAVSSRHLWRLLAEVRADNAKGEYYLTDLIGLARGEDLACAVVMAREADVLGVNSRAELAVAEARFQARARAAALESGVTMIAPETVFLSWDTLLAADVTVEPHVVFGPGVEVGSGAFVRAFSHLEGARVESGARIGPFARLRPGASIGPGAQIGNFVEVKNTRFGAGAKASHLAYLGDADVGEGANIGAGAVTCNYDGVLKYRTRIGAGAFIGSDTMLVAPVEVGAGAMTASGSVVTKDVPADALAVGRARQSNMAGWAAGFRTRKAAEAAARKKD